MVYLMPYTTNRKTIHFYIIMLFDMRHISYKCFMHARELYYTIPPEKETVRDFCLILRVYLAADSRE